jgi:hypothetical protein
MKMIVVNLIGVVCCPRFWAGYKYRPNDFSLGHAAETSERTRPYKCELKFNCGVNDGR